MLAVPGRTWPILITAGLSGMVVADLGNGVPPNLAMWVALGNLAEILVASLGLRWIFKSVPDLSDSKTLAKYLCFAAVLMPLASA